MRRKKKQVAAFNCSTREDSEEIYNKIAVELYLLIITAGTGAEPFSTSNQITTIAALQKQNGRALTKNKNYM